MPSGAERTMSVPSLESMSVNEIANILFTALDLNADKDKVQKIMEQIPTVLLGGMMKAYMIRCNQRQFRFQEFVFQECCCLPDIFSHRQVDSLLTVPDVVLKKTLRFGENEQCLYHRFVVHVGTVMNIQAYSFDFDKFIESNNCTIFLRGNHKYIRGFAIG